MKKLLYVLLLLPLSSFAQVADTDLNLEADTIRLETHAGRNTAQRVGRMFKNIIASKSNINGNTGILAIAGGGTGTASPGLVAGTNVSITGSWPNQTINSTGGGGGIVVGTTGITSGTSGRIPFNNTGVYGEDANLFWDNSNHMLQTTKIQVAPGAYTNQGFGAVGGEFQIGNNGNAMDIPLRVSHYSTLGGVGTGVAIEYGSTAASGHEKIGGVAGIQLGIGTVGSEGFDYHIQTMSGGSTPTDKLVLKSTGSLSWTSVTLINGWGNNTNHHFRVTPDDRLEVTFNLTSGSATSSTLGTVSGLTIPTPVSGSFPSSLVFVGNNGTGAFIYIRADVTSTGITFVCPNYASASGAVQVTGSIPLTAAF